MIERFNKRKIISNKNNKIRKKNKIHKFKPFQKNITQYLKLIDSRLIKRYFLQIIPQIALTIKKRGYPLWRLNQKK